MVDPHDALHEERRRNDSLVLALMQEVNNRVIAMDAKLEGHMADEKHWRDEVLSAAFPGGDAAGHKAYHDDVIETLREKKRLYSDLRSHLAKWGIVGALAFLATAVWYYVTHGPKP